MRNSGQRLALAEALDLWAASRERAVSTLARHAAILADHGCGEDADYFNFAGRSLTVKALHERGQAAAIRAASARQPALQA